MLSFAWAPAGLLPFGADRAVLSPGAPLLDLRLFHKRLFLNASLLGYVSTVALFGAEFLLPRLSAGAARLIGAADRLHPAAHGACRAAFR